jgi:hypothetical protein
MYRNLFASQHFCRRTKTRACRPSAEPLEGRQLLTALLGLTSASPNQQLLRFDSATPGTLVGSPIPINGLLSGDELRAIDVRPRDGRLYAVGVSNTSLLSAGNLRLAHVYTIDLTSTAATATALTGGGTTPTNFLVDATAIGADFNPRTDRLRVVTATGLRN